MFGLGTIINVTAIVAGGVRGYYLERTDGAFTEQPDDGVGALLYCYRSLRLYGADVKTDGKRAFSSGSMMMIACFASGLFSASGSISTRRWNGSGNG